MLHQLLEDNFLSFLKKSPRVGKAYFYQSIELITISRELAEAQGVEMINDLKNLIRTIDTTFTFTVKAKSSKLARADEAVESSTTALKHYVVHHRIAILAMDDLTQRMQKAKEKDENAMKRKATISSKVRSLIESVVTKTKTDAEVFIYVDHSWDSPHVHYLNKLTSDISLNVILFQLVERNLIQLRSNPHFYHTIPSLKAHVASNTARKGGGLLKFSDQLDEVDSASKEVKLHVLMDRSIHISFEGSHTHRIFGNIWEYEKRTYLKDIRGYLLEAEELREEIQPYGGPEVEMVTSSGPRISYKWEDVLKAAKSTQKSIVFRPVAAKTERVDSGYLSNPASPVLPALSSETSELSPPSDLVRASGPRMPSPSHIPPDRFNLTPKPHAMPMPTPDANLLNYPLGPSGLAPPLMSESSSSATSYHSAHEQEETSDPHTGGSAKYSQPVPDPHSRSLPIPHQPIGIQTSLRDVRPLGTPLFQSSAQTPRPTIVTSEPAVQTGQERATESSAHASKYNSNVRDVETASRDAPKVIHDTSTESRRNTDDRAVNTNQTSAPIDDLINGTAGKGAWNYETSGRTQSRALSHLTDKIRMQNLALDDERQHTRGSGRRSNGPSQDEDTPVPPSPAANKHAQFLSTKRDLLVDRGANNGQTLSTATNAAYSSTHLHPQSGRNPTQRLADETLDGRRTNIPPHVSNTSTAPAHNIATRKMLTDRDQSQRIVDPPASTSPAPSRSVTPLQLGPESSTGFRNPTAQSMVSHQISPTPTARVELPGTKPSASSGKIVAPGNVPAQKGPQKVEARLDSSPPSKKKSWFTRVVETVKGGVGWS